MSQDLIHRPFSRRTFLQAGGAAAGAAGATAALAACGSSSSSSGTKANARTLTVAFFGTPQAAAQVQKAVSGPFEAKHPGVKVKFNAIQGTDWNEFFSKLLTQIAGGNVPDIATVATEGLQLFAAKGLAEPLDSYVKRDASALKVYLGRPLRRWSRR
jgi:ABC-type glycerol-3-phosphate transport system substrate-binding protein